MASPSTSPGAPRTVWGTALVAPPSPDMHAQPDHHDVDDGWFHFEAEQAESELIAQVQAASLDADDSKPKGGGKGKKKAKKITLMSTTARRLA